MRREILPVNDDRQLQDALVMKSMILEHAHDLKVLIDRHGAIVFVNAAGATMLGASAAADLVGRSLADFQLVDDDGRELGEVLAAARQDGQARGHSRLCALDGRTILIEHDIFPIVDAGGEVTNFGGIFVDITARKAAEDALRSSEEKYRSLVESSDSAIAVLSRDGTVLYANSVAGSLTSVDTPAVGMNVNDLVPPALAEAVLMSLARVFDTDEDFVFEGASTLAGTYYAFRVSFQPLRDGAGRVESVLINGVNITEQKRTQQALEEAKRELEDRVRARTAELQQTKDRLEAIFHGSGDSIVLLDKSFAIRQANHTFEARFDLPPNGWAGKSLRDFFDEADMGYLERVVDDVIKSVSSEAIQVQARSAAGTTFAVEISLAPVGDEHGDLVCTIRDITARRQAERQLAEERNLLRTVIDAMPDYVFVKDRDSRLVLVNRAFADAFDIGDPASLLGQSMAHRVAPDLMAAFMEHDQTVLTTGEPRYDVVYHVATDQGRMMPAPHHQGDDRAMWKMISKLPLRNISGDVIGIVGTTRDVTALKQSELAVRASEERYRATIDAMSEGLVLHDMSGTIRICNAAAERVLGLTHEMLIGRHSIDPRWRAIHEDGSPFPGETHPAMVTLRTGVPQSNVIMGIHKPDQDLSWLSINSELVFAPDGERIGVVATFADITVLKQHQDALRASERRLELALRAGGIGVWEWDISDGFRVWDERTKQIHNTTPNHWAEVVHPEDLPRLLVELRTAVEEEQGLDTEYRIVTDEGRPRHLRVHAVLQKSGRDGNRRMFGVVLDITEQRESAAALEEALRIEKELGELKSRFVSMASHEFRTPLAAILATTETLSIYRDRMDAAQIDARLNKIRQQVIYMKGVIEDVLVLERIQAGKMNFNPSQGRLNDLFAEIVEEFSTRQKYRGRIEYTCTGPTDLSYYDDRLVRQIVSNLISNALKYSSPSTTVRVALEHAAHEVRMCVEDRGIGIPPADMEHIFEPFHRSENVSTISGTGLGLAVVRRAVDIHRGRINVDTELGHGTRVTVVLPRTGLE